MADVCELLSAMLVLNVFYTELMRKSNCEWNTKVRRTRSWIIFKLKYFSRETQYSWNNDFDSSIFWSI